MPLKWTCSQVFATFLVVIILETVALGASVRKVVLIVEAPHKVPEAMPSSELFQRAIALRRVLSERFQGLHFQGYSLTDGQSAVNPPSSSVFEDADLVIQIELRVSSLGFQADARIYDKGKRRWFEIPSTVSDSEVKIASEVIPRTLVSTLELTLPTDRAILFADCFSPASDSESVQLPARRFSVTYAQALQKSDFFQKRFSIVPLVPNIMPKFFKWWCIDLDVPRLGSLRDDTATIYGSIEPIDTTDKPRLGLLLELDSVDQSHIARDPIILDLEHADDVLQQIEHMVEGLANER